MKTLLFWMCHPKVDTRRIFNPVCRTKGGIRNPCAMCFRIANPKELAKLKKMKIIPCILLLIVASGCSSTDGVNRLKKAVFNLPWGSNTAFTKMDSLVALNILNNGYDPSLSENPRKAVFEISAKGDTSIRTLTQIFDALTTSYTRLLDQKSKEYESIDSLAKDYPLHIVVAEKTKIPPMDITLQKEIEEQIELDFSGLSKP